MPEFEIELLSDEEPELEEGQFEIELLDDEPEEEDSTVTKLGKVAKRIGQSARKGTADISMGIASTYEHKGLIREEALTPEQRAEIAQEFRKRGLSTEEEYRELAKEYVQETKEGIVKRHKDYAESVPEIDEPVFKGGVGGVLEEAATGISRFAPSMVTSAIPGMQTLGFLSTYTQLKGQKYDELVKAGTDPETANEASDIHAITSAPVEFLGNLLQIKGATKLINATLKKTGLGKRGSELVKALIMGGAGEGVEEWTQAHTEVIADVYADDPTASPSEMAQKIKEVYADPEFKKASRRAAGVGAVGGTMIPGGTAAITSPFNTYAWLQEKKRKKAAKQVEDQIIEVKDTLGTEKQAEKQPEVRDIDKAFETKEDPTPTLPKEEKVDPEASQEVKTVKAEAMSAGISVNKQNRPKLSRLKRQHEKSR